jgi:hypothetical protein
MYSCEIKSRIVITKTAFKKKRRRRRRRRKKKKKKTLLTSKLDLHLRKKLAYCYIWSTALYGAETWVLQKVDQRSTWKVLKCGAGEEWRRSVGPIV